jgi:HD-GYP domain-containing protein (c-di-GMP phosphodiesterase class II)
MNPHNPTAADRPLLRELVDGLSVPGREGTLSVGIVGSVAHAAQAPAHCQRACLGDDPAAAGTRGCPFLVSAARGVIDPAGLPDGRCRQGFQAAAQRISIGGEPAVLLTVEGRIAAEPQPVDGTQILAHLESAARLVQRIDQLLAENAGFANEVLQNYEQLNLIFDLTQQIAQVAEARAIEKLLLQRVARLLAAHAVCLVTTDGESRIYEDSLRTTNSLAPAPVVRPGEAVAVTENVRQTRQVQVSSIAGRQVIAGPLVRLDDKVDVVLGVRPPGSPAFTAGDMLLVESVLAFGGQIISNSELHERLRRMSIEVTRALVAAIDKKDHYTSGHSERGGFLTRLTAQELGVPPAEQQVMEWAGLLHDVGKIGIPEEILCKPGKLTKEEFEIIKQHPRMGYEILKPIASFELVLNGVLYHHEYPDGSGYPEGLVGDQIPLVARIIHVVDTFDALTSTRAYRSAFSIEKAMEIIEADKGTRIDATVADAFVRAFEAYRRNEPEDYAAKFPKVRERESDDAKP